MISLFGWDITDTRNELSHGKMEKVESRSRQYGKLIYNVLRGDCLQWKAYGYMGYEQAGMRGSEYPPRQQSSHSSQRMGKPFTRQRGTTNLFQYQKGRCVRHYEKSD